jgi:hypothetical protein
LLCFLLGTLSITGNFFFKIIVKITKNGVELGSFKFYWNKRSMMDSA